MHMNVYNIIWPLRNGVTYNQQEIKLEVRLNKNNLICEIYMVFLTTNDDVKLFYENSFQNFFRQKSILTIT